jgi:hypothetical protein
VSQEALRKRKEEEDRVAQQNEFLNRSVRGSRKLQALESHTTPQSPSGVVNDGYSSAEEAVVAPAAEDELKQESLHRVIGEHCTAQEGTGVLNYEPAASYGREIYFVLHSYFFF